VLLRVLLLVLLFALSGAAGADELLVVLAPTGQMRGQLPQFTRHPHPEPYVAALTRGYSGRLLRLYRQVQSLTGNDVQPAYLCVTRNQGGFPRRGFFFDETPGEQGWYVDLHQNLRLYGLFGAMDQIFPHELFHVLMRQLTGEPKPGGANQVHAVGVRTDPVVAFDEGVAEHCQILAVDDPEAEPSTRKLATDPYFRRRAYSSLDAYARELTTLSPFAWRWRIMFPVWFSDAEQALRYWAVKDNAYAHPSPVADELTDERAHAAAYFAENTLIGDTKGAYQPVARSLATESVVAHLIWRMSQTPAFSANSPDALDCFYSKLVRVLWERKPHTAAALVAAWQEVFPGDVTALEAVERETFGAPVPAQPVEIWLANPALLTGTTLFDQFRAAPRVHTFDLNAATRNELLVVPGVTTPLAERIAGVLPLARLEDLRAVPGMTQELYARFVSMRDRMKGEMARDEEEPMDAALLRILRAHLWRLAVVIAGAAVAAAGLYRLVWRTRWYRAALNGLGAVLLALPPAWVPGIPLWMALSGPIVLFALPGAAWRARRDRNFAATPRILLAWTAALAAVILVSWPWP
jgi:hypothetical protein